MYFAQGDSVLRSSNISSATPKWGILSNATTGDEITALGVSKTPANILYVGGGNGKVLKIDTANVGDPSATDLSTALVTAGASATGYVHCIYVDPSNADNVIVVYSNYNVRSIFYSSNGGTSWSNVSGNLEQNKDGTGNGPSCRWVDAITTGGTTTYYMATSTGVYSTSDISVSPVTWVQEGSTTIGSVVCAMLMARQSDGLVVVGTHGSGVFSANQTLVGVESETSNIPESFSISQNYPNPFNPSTKIKFALSSTENVKIIVYDITGRQIKELLSQNLTAGTHTVDFDASDLASGTYIYRIKAGNFVESKKMLLLK